MPKFKKYKLGELVEDGRGISYGVVQPGKYLRDGIPFLRVNNLTEGKLSEKDIEKISPIIEAKYKRTRLQGNELLISLVGSLGHIGFVKENMVGWNVARAIGVLPIKKEFDRDWIYWYLKSPKIKGEFNTQATTSVQATLNLKELQNIEISYPDELYRSKAVSILSSLDDKIELNRRMNQTLEQIAATLFKKYFVDDIDPENLPKGWRWGKLEELFYHSKESVNPTKFPDKIFLHYSIPAFDEGLIPSSDIGASILSNKFKVKSNSILFSKLNPRFPRIWPIGIINEEVSICSTEFLVFVPIKEIAYSYLYLLFKQKEIIDDLINKATGTSGSHQRIKPDDILELDVLVPKDSSLNEFEDLVRPLIKDFQKNIFENQTLSKIRDSILPKLMSGEIDISNNKNKSLHAGILS